VVEATDLRLGHDPSAAGALDRARPGEPGHVEHLPFVWPEDPKQTKWHPAEPSPIIALIKQRQGG
jgi:hypothetical protein